MGEADRDQGSLAGCLLPRYFSLGILLGVVDGHRSNGHTSTGATA